MVDALLNTAFTWSIIMVYLNENLLVRLNSIISSSTVIKKMYFIWPIMDRVIYIQLVRKVLNKNNEQAGTVPGYRV